MKRTTVFAAVVAAGSLVMALAPSAQADECDDTIRALNQQMDQIRKTRREGDSRTTICARLGRISGLTQATRIVAEQCMDEGEKRDALIKDAISSEQAFEVDNVCR